MASRPTQKVIPNDEGNIVLSAGDVALGGAVLGRAAAALGEFVELLGGEFLPLGGEHPDEVAVPDAGLVDLLLGAADRPEEILEDHPFQFLADLHRGGDALQEAGHQRPRSVDVSHVAEETLLNSIPRPVASPEPLVILLPVLDGIVFHGVVPVETDQPCQVNGDVPESEILHAILQNLPAFVGADPFATEYPNFLRSDSSRKPMVSDWASSWVELELRSGHLKPLGMGVSGVDRDGSLG